MNKCAACGTELAYEPPGAKKEPCPVCNKETSREFARNPVESIPAPIDMPKWKQQREGTDSVSTLDSDGDATLEMKGKPPRNEQDADDVSARLVRVLNASGSKWGPIQQGVGDVDWFAVDASDPAMKLQMQVVRALVDKKVWESLARSQEKKIDLSRTVATAADDLLAAVQKKFDTYKTAERRAALALVLDATRIPSHTFAQVIDDFRARHLAACKALGFDQVWIVGPRDELVSRLDG